MKIDNWLEGHWALILGASSGFGAEVSRKLSEYGVNILGIHLDRKNTMKNVDEVVSYVESNNVKVKFFNINAADENKRNEVLDQEIELIGGYDKKIKIIFCWRINSLMFKERYSLQNSNLFC